MADSLPEQRTELPTGKRMSELRSNGQLFISQDVVHVSTLVVGFITVSRCVEGLGSKLSNLLTLTLHKTADTTPLTVRELHIGFMKLLGYLGPTIFLMLLFPAVTAIFAVMLQSNWNRRKKLIKFTWPYLNPLAGLQRMVSPQSFFNTIKAVAKLCLMLPIGYFVLRGLAPEMVGLVGMSLVDVLNLTTNGLKFVFWKITYVLLVLAVFDYFWGKFNWLKQVKMTKDEVKDERKSTEGDELTKRKIIQKGFKRIAQRLQFSVPKADVIITNPTHYAVALKYDRERAAAPIVVAKGQDFIALRIREIAKEHNIPILERKALARALYASTDVDKEIPRELFRAVAEVLAYVYKLKRPSWQSRSGTAK